jgi:outer membrane protein assembly factor BamB
MGSQIQSSPSIGTDGTIYFGTDAGLVYAVSSTGEVIWKYQTRGAVISTPALSQKDMIFFGSWDKQFYALRASTGVLLWSYEVADFIQSSPVIDENNDIYFCSGSNVYAFYDTGDPKWKIPIRGISNVSPALSLDGILFLTNDISTLPFNSLISLNASDGSKYIDPSFFKGDQVSYSSPLVSQERTAKNALCLPL